MTKTQVVKGFSAGIQTFNCPEKELAMNIEDWARREHVQITSISYTMNERVQYAIVFGEKVVIPPNSNI